MNTCLLCGRWAWKWFGLLPCTSLTFNSRFAINQELGKPITDEVTRDEMASLTRLNAPSQVIRDLTGLEFAKNLNQSKHSLAPDCQSRSIGWSD